MTLLKFTHVSVDCFRRLLKLDCVVHFIPDTYNFVLLRQDSQIQNYTPKKSKMCIFSPSIWKILHLADLLTRALVNTSVPLTNIRFGFPLGVLGDILQARGCRISMSTNWLGASYFPSQSLSYSLLNIAGLIKDKWFQTHSASLKLHTVCLVPKFSGVWVSRSTSYSP